MSHESAHPTNPIAIAGLAFAGLTCAIYAVAFLIAGSLPEMVAELETLSSAPAEMTRFLITLGSAVLLNLVALSLSITGMILPRRPRIAAMLGILIAGVLLMAIPGVIALGLIGAK